MTWYAELPSHGAIYIQGIQQQRCTGQISHLIAFFPGYFVFKNEKCQSESKIRLCLQHPPSTLELSPPS
jgi:hypothetical protein